MERANSINCAFLFCFFLTLVDQVTVFVSVGVCAVAGAVSQVSFDLKQVPRGWGINMHIFVSCFSCITQHVEGVGCLHPPVTNKVWWSRKYPGFPQWKSVFPLRRSRRGNSKISAEEKKERREWGRVELGQLGTSWSSNSSGDENCLWCEDVCLRCAIFSEDYRENERWKLLTWRVENKKISEERYQWKFLRKLQERN